MQHLTWSAATGPATTSQRWHWRPCCLPILGYRMSVNSAIDTTDAIEVPGIDFGPAMMALPSDRHRNFVLFHVIDVVEDNHANAARRAGFGRSNSSAETFAKLAYRLLQDAAIQAAILEVGKRYLGSLISKALRACDEVMGDENAKDADRLRAASAVLDRTFGVTTSLQVQVEHTHHIDHTAAAIEALRWMKQMDVPHAKLVEHFGESGLGRYEKKLAEEDIKAGKVIGGEVA
jgi:hypothetical protein